MLCNAERFSSPGERLWEQPANSEASAPALGGPVMPAAGFTGARSGYAFKMGPNGLGYYLEPLGPAAACGAAPTLQEDC